MQITEDMIKKYNARTEKTDTLIQHKFNVEIFEDNYHKRYQWQETQMRFPFRSFDFLMECDLETDGAITLSCTPSIIIDIPDTTKFFNVSLLLSWLNLKYQEQGIIFFLDRHFGTVNGFSKVKVSENDDDIDLRFQFEFILDKIVDLFYDISEALLSLIYKNSSFEDALALIDLPADNIQCS